MNFPTITVPGFNLRQISSDESKFVANLQRIHFATNFATNKVRAKFATNLVINFATNNVRD